jgi:hypothetical protein
MMAATEPAAAAGDRQFHLEFSFLIFFASFAPLQQMFSFLRNGQDFNHA